MRALSVEGALELTPTQFPDDRGLFLEYFRSQELSPVVGREFHVAQANCSVSRQGVVRGIHFADVPPGQAKYVTCFAGEIMDVVVDLRLGSPTYGQWDSVTLDDHSRRAVFLPEGLGHAFMAMSPSATVAYLCSTVYNPKTERTIHPLDPDIAITWPAKFRPILSAKDTQAASFAAARSDNLLPDYRRCSGLEKSP